MIYIILLEILSNLGFKFGAVPSLLSLPRNKLFIKLAVYCNGKWFVYSTYANVFSSVALGWPLLTLLGYYYIGAPIGRISCNEIAVKCVTWMSPNKMYHLRRS
jgi:hypothetical protein